MDAAPPAFDLAQDAPAAFHAASGCGFWYGPTIRLCKISYFPEHQQSEIYAVQTDKTGAVKSSKLLAASHGKPRRQNEPEQAGAGQAANHLLVSNQLPKHEQDT